MRRSDPAKAPAKESKGRRTTGKGKCGFTGADLKPKSTYRCIKYCRFQNPKRQMAVCNCKLRVATWTSFCIQSLISLYKAQYHNEDISVPSCQADKCRHPDGLSPHRSYDSHVLAGKKGLHCGPSTTLSDSMSVNFHQHNRASQRDTALTIMSPQPD